MILSLFLIFSLSADEGDILFVSLGSTCAPATLTRLTETRTASFPFDWIVSQDINALIEMLDEDFSHFFTPEDLIRDDLFRFNYTKAPVTGKVLLNSYYHLEFLHEVGDWKRSFDTTMASFKERYERRISRFKSLNAFQGKVVFIRSAYPFHDPHRFFRFKENSEISQENALRLYDALRRFFPHLDFTLIVRNYHEKEKRWINQLELSEGLMMITAPMIEDHQALDLYRPFFDELIGERTLFSYDNLNAL